MRTGVRNALALVGGMLAAAACVAGAEMVGHALLSPDAAFVAPVAALGLGTLIGGSIAVRVAGAPTFAWIIAAVLAALSLVNLLSFAHPYWFVPAAAAALALGGWAASRTASRAAPLS